MFLIAWLILRAASGLGLPAAQPAWLEITPLASQEAPLIAEVQTAGGPMRLPGVEPGLALVCSGGENIAVSCTQQYVEADAAIEPVLQRGVRVLAHVRAGRQNVAGARAFLVPKSLRSRRFVTLPLGREKGSGRLFREVVTDAVGRLKTPQLAPGDYLLQVISPSGEIHHQAISVPRPEALLPKGSQNASAEAVLDLGEIALAEGVSVSVFVTGPAGEPIAGAKVGALQRDPSSGDHFFETTADGQGKAVISGLAPALKVGVTCQMSGFLRMEQRFDAPPVTAGCSLEPLAQVQGSVLGNDRRAVAGATVSSRAIERPATTAKDGRFWIVELAAGTYALTAAAPGFAPEKVSVTLAAGERRELPPIELTPGRRIRGVVTDGGSGEPVSGAQIAAVEPPGAVEAVSDEDGEVTFPLGEEPLRLRAAAEGYPDTEIAIDPEKLDTKTLDGEKPLEIKLERGGRLQIEDWDEEADLPCAGCAVSLQAFRLGRSTRVVTDGRGVSLTELLPPGPYAVSSVTERSLGGVVEVQGGAETRRVEVVAGTVTPVSLGEKSRVIQVRFRPPVPDAWRLSASAPSGSRMGERLGDGSFEVRRRPGPVTLSLHENTTTVHQAVLPADDDRSLIELPLPGGMVRGSLAAGEGTSAPGRLLTVVSADNGNVQASALIPDGSAFGMPFLAPGSYTLLVDGRPVRSFLVAPDREIDLGSVR